jgi:hypothetical protein
MTSNKKEKRTALRSFLCGIQVVDGDSDNNVDPTAIMLRKVSANVRHISQKELQDLMDREGLTEGEARKYITLVTQTPFVYPGRGAVSTQAGFEDLYYRYSGYNTVRLSMVTQPTVYGIRVPTHATPPEIYPPTMFRIQFSEQGKSLAQVVYDSFMDNHEEVNTNYGSTYGYKFGAFVGMGVNDTPMAVINSRLAESLGDQVIFSTLQHSRFRLGYYHPGAKKLFKAIVMVSGSGKTTLAERFRTRCVDIDDVLDVEGDAELRALHEKARDENRWEDVNKAHAKIFSSFLERRPDLGDRVYLIHHPGQFSPDHSEYSPLVYGVYKPEIGEVIAEADKRRKDSVSLTKPKYILGGKRGYMSVEKKIFLLNKFGPSVKYFVDGATPPMLRYPDKGIIYVGNQQSGFSEVDADRYQLPEGHSVHARSGPAAKTYAAFTHVPFEVGYFSHDGKEYSIMNNTDTRTEGDGNVFDHFVRALEGLLEGGTKSSNSSTPSDIIEFDNAWKGNSWRRIGDGVGVIWSKQELDPSHKPHLDYIARKEKVPGGTVQIINNDFRDLANGFDHYVGMIVRHIIRMRLSGFTPIHVWLQGKFISEGKTYSFRDQMDAIYSRLDEEEKAPNASLPKDKPRDMSKVMRMNWEGVSCEPLPRRIIAADVANLLSMEPVVLNDRLFRGMGSVVTSCHAVFGLGRSLEEVITQDLHKVATGVATSGHLLASCIAHKHHMLWYVYEVFINLQSRKSIYLFPFREPEGGVYHSKQDYDYTLQLLQDKVRKNKLPRYAELHVELLSDLFRIFYN